MSVSPRAVSVEPLTSHREGCLVTVSECNKNLITSASDTGNGLVSPLIPLARRSGLEAVAAAYDAGLSVPAVRS